MFLRSLLWSSPKLSSFNWAVKHHSDWPRHSSKRVFPSLDWQTQRHDGFAALELSNAYLVAQGTYTRLLPCFERQLAGLDGDLPAFIATHLESPGSLDCETP